MIEPVVQLDAIKPEWLTDALRSANFPPPTPTVGLSANSPGTTSTRCCSTGKSHPGLTGSVAIPTPVYAHLAANETDF